jgi:hypothetical protein
MNRTGLVKYAGAAVALAVCSACAGGSTVAPSTAAFNATYVGRTLFLNGRPVTAARVSPPPRHAMILPDRRAETKTFVYIINVYGSYASIFDYPKSDKQIGTINNVGGQGCTNVIFGYGKKKFWIVAGARQITEYTVPKTPIKTLSVSSVGGPSSCAMNGSGDLAVGILFGSGSGDIVIFPHAGGSRTVMTTPLSGEYGDGYDPGGDLFADGFSGSLSSPKFKLVELPKGREKFRTITTSNPVKSPGSVQWDGKYVTVTDQDTNEMYQYTISGTKATLKGTVHLSGGGSCAQTWIATDVVYCADAANDDGEVFKYPAGGSAIAVLTGDFDFPLGVTAAEK